MLVDKMDDYEEEIEEEEEDDFVDEGAAEDLEGVEEDDSFADDKED